VSITIKVTELIRKTAVSLCAKAEDGRFNDVIVRRTCVTKWMSVGLTVDVQLTYQLHNTDRLTLSPHPRTSFYAAILPAVPSGHYG